MKKTLLALAMFLIGSATYGQAATYSAKVSFTAPVNSPVPVTGYQVYKSSTSGACAAGLSTCTLLTATPITALTYTDAGLTAGSTTYYSVRAVSAQGVLSDSSAEGIANLAKPGSPGGISVQVTVVVSTP